ncbi:hypothetical protein [Calidifontibacter indicus]|uniref:Uncharacterized protein n=1 Tax=Calidifontibacter indicus TaxID=419650 RepID=A0A3D9UMT6_9MICO|nr:hypothetical protein [Calidifontibacter indicus]REF30637.1 hypothetical protein DFJ65_1652 [Calidifontibacter indicus]
MTGPTVATLTALTLGLQVAAPVVFVGIVAGVVIVDYADRLDDRQQVDR